MLDKGVEQNNSRIMFDNWKLDGDNLLNKTIQFIILLIGHIREVIGGFLQDPHYLGWVATLDPIRSLPEPPPWGNFPSHSVCFMYIHIHDALRTMHEMSMGINVGSGNWSKLGKNTEIHIDSKMGTESQSWGSGSHS